MEFTHFKVEFTKDGKIFDQSQRDALLAAVPKLTDLILISHGWNNDIDDATELYDRFFASIGAITGVAKLKKTFASLEGRKCGVVRVFWPSKKFAPTQLIPAGGVASIDDVDGPVAKANETVLVGLLEELKRDPVRLGGKEIDPKRKPPWNEPRRWWGSSFPTSPRGDNLWRSSAPLWTNRTQLPKTGRRTSSSVTRMNCSRN